MKPLVKRIGLAVLIGAILFLPVSFIVDRLFFFYVPEELVGAEWKPFENELVEKGYERIGHPWHRYGKIQHLYRRQVFTMAYYYLIFERDGKMASIYKGYGNGIKNNEIYFVGRELDETHTCDKDELHEMYQLCPQ